MSHDYAPSRRQMLVGGALLSAMLPGATLAKTLNPKPFAMHDMDDWQAQIGKTFSVGGTPARLVAVKAGGRQPYGMARRNNFTTIFEVKGAVPAAGTHTVSHAELGQAALYLEPSIAKNGQPRLRASFS